MWKLLDRHEICRVLIVQIVDLWSRGTKKCLKILKW